MKSEDVLNDFPPIEFDKSLVYLKKLPCSISSVIREFSELTEEQMASYRYPPHIKQIQKDYLDSPNGKSSTGFKSFNTVITAINILKSCAQLNVAIYALRDKLSTKETEHEKMFPFLSDSVTNRYSRSLERDYHSSEMKYLSYTTDADLLKIKNAAIDARDRIHGYSKKYTIEGFEENFINNIKYNVFSICDKFRIETRTITEKTTETGENIIGNIIAFALFILVFILVGKCATGQ